ncbi:DUF4214 domain-containing protein, partial [Siccirubricoccus sp. KC 17139]
LRQTATDRTRLDDADFLSAVLENTLGTAPRAMDLAYWSGFLAGVGGDRGDALLRISELPEHQEALLELPVSGAEFSPIG